MNLYAILAAIALSILALAEVLVSVQKAQMKKQFLNQLSLQDKQMSGGSESTKDDGTQN